MIYKNIPLVVVGRGWRSLVGWSVGQPKHTPASAFLSLSAFRAVY